MSTDHRDQYLGAEPPPQWRGRPQAASFPEAVSHDPAAPALGQATMTIACKYPRIVFMFGFFTPRLTIDGYAVQASWQRATSVPVTPGTHRVHVHVPYFNLWRLGPADLDVRIEAGQHAELEYRPPLVMFLRGALGAPPQKYPGLVANILISVFIVIAMLCSVISSLAATVSTATLTAGDLGYHSGGLLPDPSAASTGPALPGLEAGAGTPAQPSPAGPLAPDESQPQLRTDAPERTVVGARFAPGDRTYTMRFDNWPFAFRTPSTWGCLRATTKLPGGRAYLCIDEGSPGSGQRAGIVMRPCPGTCTGAQRRDLRKDVLGATSVRRVDADTAYHQPADQGEGRYQLVVSHFFGDPDERWQVAVDATSPWETRASVQKIANDIVSQTS